MSVYLYRLHFSSPLHFGLHGIGLEAVEERLASDALTSAIVNAFAVMEGEKRATELVEALANSPPAFVLSSLFPFGPAPDSPETVVEAVPRPLTNPPVGNTETLRKYGKDLKQIRYLRVDDLLGWIGNEELKESQVEPLIHLSKRLTEGWWHGEMRPRVALDRVSSNSSIWNQGAIRFSSERRDKDGKQVRGAGLYGLVRFSDEGWKDKLAAAFRLLGEMGLGGERTYGLGLFQFGGFGPPSETWRALLGLRSRFHVLFSVYYPSDTERKSIQEGLEAWETTERRGYVVSGRATTTIKRKRIRMISEGSVARRLLQGKMVDVTPDHATELGIPHRVYRSGLAFLVPGGGL